MLTITTVHAQPTPHGDTLTVYAFASGHMCAEITDRDGVLLEAHRVYPSQWAADVLALMGIVVGAR